MALTRLDSAQGMHLVDDAVYVGICQGYGGVVVQQRCHQPFHLARLDPASLIEVIDLEGNCSRPPHTSS